MNTDNGIPMPMKVIRPDLLADLAQLRDHPEPERRAFGDNVAFDEHVGDERRADFENSTGTASTMAAAVDRYFFESVQGARRNHIPSTFLPINRTAWLPTALDHDLRLMRLERIDVVLSQLALDVAELQEAVELDFARLRVTQHHTQ